MRMRHLTIVLCATLAAGALTGCDTRGTGTIAGVVRPISGLSALTLSVGSLTPSFNPNTTAYTASVPNATTSITMTPTAATSGSTILVNGNDVASGATSPPLLLSVGANNVDIVITGPSGASQRTYRVVVTRQTT